MAITLAMRLFSASRVYVIEERQFHAHIIIHQCSGLFSISVIPREFESRCINSKFCCVFKAVAEALG
jgi:hypothetical protein